MKKKKLKIFLFTIVMFYLNIDFVYGISCKAIDFPDYKLNYPVKDGNQEEILNIPYCKYNMGYVLDMNGGDSGEGNRYYSNKDIYLAYWDTHIYYINPSTNTLSLNGVYWKNSNLLNDGCLPFLNHKQKIDYDFDKLAKYLIQNESLKCKNLYFLESSDDLTILTPEEYEEYNLPDWQKNNITGSVGTLMYQGQDYSTVCNEKLNDFESIKNLYNSISIDADLEQLKSFSTYEITIDNLEQVRNRASSINLEISSKLKYAEDSINHFKKEINDQAINIGICDNNILNNINEFEKKITDWEDLLKNSFTSYTTHITESMENLEISNEVVQSIQDDLEKQLEEINRWIEEYKNKRFDLNIDMDFGGEVNVNCDGILGQDLIDYLDKIFGWIRIAVPIIVIVLGSLDFGQAVLQDDKDALQKAIKKFTTRCIIAVIIFFIPTILIYLLEIFNNISKSHITGCGIGGLK